MDAPSLPEGSSGSPVQRRVLWGLLLAVLLAVGFMALMGPRWMREGSPSAEELPVFGQIPPFELVNRDGREVSREDLLGRPWIADFIFTSCRVSCPAMTQRMASLRTRFPSAQLHLVSVSVDPENDRPEVLEEYAKTYEAQDRWLFLTGEKEEIYGLIRDGFKLGVQPAPPEEAASSLEPITHSTRFVLVDAAGRIRGYYDAFDTAALSRLLQDLRKLL